MIKVFQTLLIIVLSASAFGQTVNYKLSMSRPQSHYFEVEMEISNIKSSTIEVKMPVWAPGSYLVREFSKNVNLVTSTAGSNIPIKVEKVAKNKWVIENGKASTIKVKYEVYAFELSVRTSFLDLTHGFVSGTGVFMYVESAKGNKGRLDIVPYKDFSKINTALPKAAESLSSDGVQSFVYEHYDQLVDCPIEIGNQEVFNFMAAGVNHTVAIYGEGNYDVAKLKVDMAKIVETTSAVIGENPNKEYTFIIHNVVDGQGGLEHMNSTTLSVNRWTYEGSDYIGFLSLVAHEYFHLWNVKRIRPIELGPFNYDEENYTTLLWVMEGFTSYYDELLLRRAGYYTQEQYVSKLNNSLNYVEGSVGARVQPVAHASFDAWIKAYRPNENSSNTTMTYYTRGQMIATCFDMMIIEKYKGKKCLDHFLQELYKKYYLKLNRGFSKEEFQEALEDFLKTDLDQFFNDYIYGTKIPDYKSIFAKVGLDVTYIGRPQTSFGASLRQEGSSLMVKRIRSGSAAEDGGLSVNDEIVGCNGYRVNQAAFEGVVSKLNTGETIKVLVSRDEILLELTFRMTDYEQPKYSLTLIDSKTTDMLKNYWLR
jgi:predicted metalloprotease with PDZ domain